MVEENVEVRNIAISVVVSSAIASIFTWMLVNHYVKRSLVNILEEYEVEPPTDTEEGWRFKDILMDMAEEALRRALEKFKQTGE